MSAARAGPSPPEPDADLDRIADELYALRPDAFAAARDEQVRAARAEGRQPLARELSRLRKPTQSAWLINLLWRDQPQVLSQLFELANELSRAQAQASGPELQRLTTQRRQLEAELIRQAKALARKAGVDVSATMEREAQETLGAALASPDVADEVRTGRLVKPASYAGFGTLPSSPTPLSVQPPAEPKKIDRIEDLSAQRARQQREVAQRRVDEARATVEAAADELTAYRLAAEEATKRRSSIRERIEQLKTELRELDREDEAAERSELVTGRRRDQADEVHQAAVRKLERAERELNALP